MAARFFTVSLYSVLWFEHTEEIYAFKHLKHLIERLSPFLQWRLFAHVHHLAVIIISKATDLFLAGFLVK